MHSLPPRPPLVAEHRTPCRPDAHGRGSRPQPAPPMTHAATPSNMCRSQPALPVPPCRPSHRCHNTICNRFGAPARPFSNAVSMPARSGPGLTSCAWKTKLPRCLLRRPGFARPRPLSTIREEGEWEGEPRRRGRGVPAIPHGSDTEGRGERGEAS